MKTEKHYIQNPIIPGFYPDPSIVRVGEDYYIANSSFELCPAIPIWHSRDLAHWEQLGYALSKENGLHMVAEMGNGGMMAPTLRYHDGTFYIICANFADRGNFLITAKDPAGPWSTPTYITDVPDIDCSLFFDTDGSTYLVSPGDDPEEDNARAIFLTPYDLVKLKAIGPKKKIWNSALRKAWAPEAPHLYHIGEYYYLMIAEGGTDHFHSITIARSTRVDDFYEGNPANPIMTHRHLGWNYPIDNIGHADLVETPGGKWYAVMLGSRVIDGQHKNLGRETYICPVEWQRNWPVFSPGTGKIEFSYPADPELPWIPYKGEKLTDDFDNAQLGMAWSVWGTDYQPFWRLSNSNLYLKCLKRPFAEKLSGFKIGVIDERRDNCVSFIGRRQTLISYTVTTAMNFSAEKNEAAGLVIMQAANHQYRMERINSNGSQMIRIVRLTTKQQGRPFLPGYKADTRETVLAKAIISADTLILRIKVERQKYSFYYGTSSDKLNPLLENENGAVINPESVGGMVGTMIGVFATANGENSENEAAFDFVNINQL